MLAFDASSLIHAWDNYPQTHFPAVWDWIADQFSSGEFEVSRVAYDEVGHKAPECIDWLRGKGVTPIEIDNAAIVEANHIKAVLGIVNEQYGSGVDENDILIIALAKTRGREVVTEENRQTNPPTLMRNSKIPAVCWHTDVNVGCPNFIEVIRRSQIVFR